MSEARDRKWWADHPHRWEPEAFPNDPALNVTEEAP